MQEAEILRLPDGARPKERHKPSEWHFSTPRNEPTWQYAYSYAISTYSEKIPSRMIFLGGKEPAEVLTHLVGSIEGPCVMAVNAAWGAGKET